MNKFETGEKVILKPLYNPKISEKKGVIIKTTSKKIYVMREDKIIEWFERDTLKHSCIPPLYYLEKECK